MAMSGVLGSTAAEVSGSTWLTWMAGTALFWKQGSAERALRHRQLGGLP